MISAIIKRDIRAAWRSGGAWLLGVIFFALFLTLCAIGLGGHADTLKTFAPALIWLAVIFSALLSFFQIFTGDYMDGSLEQLLLAPGGSIFGSGAYIILAKFTSYLIIFFLPIWVTLPLAGVLLGLEAVVLQGLALALICAAPTLAAYGVLAGALTLTRNSGGFLIILITVPFFIPLLIYGIAATENFTQNGIRTLELRALLGLSFIACATALPAAVAALKTNFE